MESAESAESMYCVNLKDIKDAAKRIEGIAHRTPVLSSTSINKKAKRHLFFKVEAMQKTGSFKFRGALNAVKSVVSEQPDEEIMFVSHSSGNHAQALALAAKLSGQKATIVMPNNTPSVKKAAVADFGATIVIVENTNEAREDKATEIVNESGGGESSRVKTKTQPYPFTSCLKLLIRFFKSVCTSQ
jgi:threonine dehydratase